MYRILLLKTRYILRLVISVPVLPLLFFQGRRIKASIPELPEADKNRIGAIGQQLDSLKILCLGESTMAGVGVKDHRDGLAGVIAQKIHQQSLRGVHWTVVARSGFTAREVKEKLLPQVPGKIYDLIVIGLGGNDTFQLSSPWKWRRAFVELLGHLRESHGQAKIVIANMPPIKWFPAFPPLMRWLMTGQIRLLKKAIEDFPQKFDGVYFLKDAIQMDYPGSVLAKNFRHRDLFSDGVHPSKLAYRIWGEQVGDFIVDKVLSKNRS